MASRAAVLFHSVSRAVQRPWQVLFPPDTSTIHVSGPEPAEEVVEGASTERQFSRVRGVMLRAAAALAALLVVAVVGMVAAEGRKDFTFSSQPWTGARKGNCCWAMARAGSARRSEAARRMMSCLFLCD